MTILSTSIFVKTSNPKENGPLLVADGPEVGSRAFVTNPAHLAVVVALAKFASSSQYSTERSYESFIIPMQTLTQIQSTVTIRG